MNSAKSTDTYSKNVIYNDFVTSYSIVLNEVLQSKKCKKYIIDNINSVSCIDLATFIINNFNKFVTDDNKHGFITFTKRLNGMKNKQRTNSEKRVKNLSFVCKDFVMKAMQHTGINLYIRLDGNNADNIINESDLYYYFNHITPVISCSMITKNEYVITCLHNFEAKNIAAEYESRNVRVGKHKFTIKCEYIEPANTYLCKKFTWGSKNYVDCIKLPYKKPREIPIRDIIEYSNYADQFYVHETRTQ